MENIKPGSILINTSTNKLYGVLVSILTNNKIIVFRLDKNTHPIFSKLDIHPYITKVGIINEFQYSTLKNALLKYYRTYNLTPSEKKMMESLMIFAFPLGVPEYQPNVELPERDIEFMDLHSKLMTGNRIMINTPSKSCYNHLNNKTVDIIEKNDKGIWVNMPSNENDVSKLGNSMSFLFYKNRDTPTFGGISRISPIECGNASNSNNNTNTKNAINNENNENNENNQNTSAIIEAFKKLKENDELTTMMEFNGDKVRIMPSTCKIIFPDVYQNMIYNPHTDNFTIEKENITPALSNKLGNKLIISGIDNKGKVMEISGMGMDNELLFKGSNYNKDDFQTKNMSMKINEDGEIVYEGGGKKTKLTETESDTEDLKDIEQYEKYISKYISQAQDLGNSKRNYSEKISINKDSNENDEYDEYDNDGYNNDEYDKYDNDVSDFYTIKSDNDDTIVVRDLETPEVKDKLNRNRDRNRLSSTSSTSSKNSNTDSDDFDETNFEEIIDEDDIEILDTFEKVKKVELGELEKVYKETIQKGDLLKYKIEQLPVFKRNNPEIIKNIKKEINIISLLKHSITENTGGINQIKFKPQDYKPLVSKYIKGDFTNKYLIPLVINRKKIYLNKDKKIDKDEYDPQSNEIIEDYFESIHNLSYLQDKKNIALNNDVYTQKIINELNPTSTNDNDSLGMLFRLGDKLKSNDYSRLSQDTVTITYCDKPMKCSGYGTNTMDFDYQVNLGPMGRFITQDLEQDLENPAHKAAFRKSRAKNDGENDDVDDEGKNDDVDDEENYDNNEGEYDNDNDLKEKSDINILYSNPKFKLYYPGDWIRIIGYVRPPLNYFNNPDSKILQNLYKSHKHQNKIITIKLKDINPELMNDNDNDDGDDDSESKGEFSITQHPDKFILFLMPNEGINYNDIETQIEKIIPSIDDVIKLYMNNKETNSVDNIYTILKKFDYDYNELTFDMYNKIIKENKKYIDLFDNLNTKIQSKFEVYKKKVIQDKKIKEDNQNRFKKRITRDRDAQDTNSKNNKYKYITDDVMDDISNFYFNTYDNKDISVDADEIRLKWFKKNFDNGRFLFKTLLINYLKMYQESHNLENLETEFAIIKEKYVMMSNSIDMMGQSSMTPNLSSSSQLQSSSQTPSKNTFPNIIKYPNMERLDKDNGKVAIDSDGVVIMPGDYALVDVNNIKQLFKREVIGNIDMWVKEEIAMLYKLIQDKKNNCVKNPELNIEKENLYNFDMDRLKCTPKEIMESSIENLLEKHKVELHVNDLQKEIDYIKNIPILIAKLNKEIIHDRMYLVNKVNSMKNYIKYKEEDALKLDENIKSTLQTVKPCIHFQIVEHFHKINSEYEKYTFADSILKQFEDTEIDSKIGANNDCSHYNKTDNDKNFTHCNICSQKLLCNHHKLIVHYLNNEPTNNSNNAMNQIDFNKIVDIYGVEQDGSYICSACNISIQTTEILDLEDFAKGEDGGAIKTREISKNIPVIEQQKEYINSIINKLYDTNSSDDSNDSNAGSNAGGNAGGNAEESRIAMSQRINIFKLMKLLSNVDMLNIKDEIEMVNFLKSYQFDKKENIFILIKEQIGTSNLPLLKKLVEKTYLNHLIADIGARFLIILQTSTINYKINIKFANKIKNETYNEDCNTTTIFGYPLINNIEEKDGITYMMCLFSQLAIYPEYTTIADYKEIKFIEKIKRQVENDNLVKEKIQSALVSKANTIIQINEFDNYYTNNWKEFKPRLDTRDITWVPEKILNQANLKEITYNNIDKMINVGIENSIYYSLNVINKINTVVVNSVSFNKVGLLNNCCVESYNEHKKLNYMEYFYKRNNDISKNTNLFKEVIDILSKIKNIGKNPIENIIYEPLYKPSQIMFKVQFNITSNDIKDMYLKYIDRGINKGKEHIYDKYGRCILSNVKKIDIENQSYSIQDYKRIETSITSGNKVTLNHVNIKNNGDKHNGDKHNGDKHNGMIDNSEGDKDYDVSASMTNVFINSGLDSDLDSDLDSNKNSAKIRIEKNKIDELISNIPKLDIFIFLKDFFKKIKENENDIFESHSKENIKPLSKTHKDKFDIYKHLGNLKTHIDDEINNLVKKITATDKNINKYRRILSNIGDFKQLYEDYKLNNSNDININEKSELFRYSKQEDYLQFSIKYLNDIINQIKNNKLSNSSNRDRIRTQYRDFIMFGEKNKLFKILGNTTREIYNFVKLIKSKQNYKVLFPELVSNMLHYLNILSLANLFNILKHGNLGKLGNLSKLGKIDKSNSENMEFNFQVSNDKSEDKSVLKSNLLKDLKTEINLGIDEEDILDTEEDINFFKGFELKNSDNLKAVSEFILKYLDNINKNQDVYDELTEKRIKTETANLNQKRIERTLKALKTLSEEGNEEKKMLLYIQMRVFKKIDYSNLAENVDKLFEDENAIVYNTIDTYEDNTELDTDNINGVGASGDVYGESDGNDYNIGNNIGNIVSRDDDEGEQDYDAQAVDED